MRRPVRAGDPAKNTAEYGTEIYDAEDWLVCNANGYVVRDTIIAALNDPQPALAAICELDGCCMLRDKPQPQEEKS